MNDLRVIDLENFYISKIKSQLDMRKDIEYSIRYEIEGSFDITNNFSDIKSINDYLLELISECI